MGEDLRIAQLEILLCFLHPLRLRVADADDFCIRVLVNASK
jgi:hypothetical protein